MSSVLVCSHIAARGLDVPNITHVIQVCVCVGGGCVYVCMCVYVCVCVCVTVCVFVCV